MDLKSTYNKIAENWDKDHKKDTWWISGTDKFISLLKPGSLVCLDLFTLSNTNEYGINNCVLLERKVELPNNMRFQDVPEFIKSIDTERGEMDIGLVLDKFMVKFRSNKIGDKNKRILANFTRRIE